MFKPKETRQPDAYRSQDKPKDRDDERETDFKVTLSFNDEEEAALRWLAKNEKRSLANLIRVAICTRADAAGFKANVTGGAE